MIIFYLASDYLLEEKRRMDLVDDSLKREEFTGEKKKRMENLAQWHFQNCMRMLTGPGIPKSVKDYIYGWRAEPTIQEIQSDYQEMRDNYKEKHRLYERAMLRIAIPFTILMIIGLTLWLS